ncbi:P-loop containing nucleoside triphosphate hydrolase protein [Fomitopsis betulina]|nr:P-loop containing nucleoside triphosphate hydrolase protein [Fomitopsis betulina]
MSLHITPLYVCKAPCWRKTQNQTVQAHRSEECENHTSVRRPAPTEVSCASERSEVVEEISIVEVVYEETKESKIAKFKVVSEPTGEQAEADEEPVIQSLTSSERNIASSPSQDDIEVEDTHFDGALHMLVKALYTQHSTRPTPFQAEALPLALAKRDVVGIAETGSGKTLAHGLPILDHLLKHASSSPSKERQPVRALVLTPMCELALQGSLHLNACLNHVDALSKDVEEGDEAGLPTVSPPKKPAKQNGKGKEQTELTKRGGPPPVSVAAIVGGMSAPKQRRILLQGVDVLVATPGRLWDIIQQVSSVATILANEADRMIETGHFAEMESIIRLTLRQSKHDEIEPERTPGLEPENDETEVNSKARVKEREMQTFIFSATLSKNLQKTFKQRSRPHKNKNGEPATTLDDLLMRLDFRDPAPAVIDIAPQGGVVATLQESKIECLTNDKDAYAYYFLLRYPGRTLVFLSSIDGIRRLTPIMSLMDIPAFPLHSQLEQRQRLKNLDRFKSTPRGVLLATDVAAHGLDVPAVDHVVHYQAPRTQTHTCTEPGRRIVRALVGSLQRKDEIPEMPVELYMLDKLKAQVALAREIDTAQHREAAEAMEIEPDSDLDVEEHESVPTKAQQKAADTKVSRWKANVKRLLAQPLVAKGVSPRYITSGTVSIADDMLAGKFHDMKAKTASVKQEDGEFEEWGEISC